MAHLSTTMQINAPVEVLNAIVRDPHNWPKFQVGMGEPERVFGDGGPGTKVEFTQLMMGVKLRLVQRTIEERHDPDGSTFWRWELEGTAPGWITCHHQPHGDGCQITTNFEYAVPGSVLGKVADRLLIERRERRDFESSLENLKLLAEARVKATPAEVTT
jgi:coenzyme Q-binding protein COQ10